MNHCVYVYVYFVQVAVGDVNVDELRAVASAGHQHTVLIDSNWTILTSRLVNKLTDLSCNSK